MNRFALAALLCATLFAAAPPPAPLAATHLKLACSTTQFRGIDRAELISTAKFWLQTLGKHEGLNIADPEVVLADTVGELRNLVDTGTVDLVVSSSLEYLALDRARVLTPEVILTAAPGDNGKIRYVLLVNRAGGVNTLADLNGKALNTYSRSASNLNRLWLDVLLGTAHLPGADMLFRSVSLSTKPSTACLPIFFGKSDACLIDGPSWDTLRELNQQVAVKLKVLAESQPLVESMVSLRVGRQEYRSQIMHAMRTLQDDSEGRQVLLLFKCSRAAGIDAAALDQVAQLRAAYLKMTRPADRRIALPAVGPAVGAVESPKAP